MKKLSRNEMKKVIGGSAPNSGCWATCSSGGNVGYDSCSGSCSAKDNVGAKCGDAKKCCGGGDSCNP